MPFRSKSVYQYKYRTYIANFLVLAVASRPRSALWGILVKTLATICQDVSSIVLDPSIVSTSYLQYI